MAELGDLVKDKITGFVGCIEIVSNYLNGCRRMGIKPIELREGKPIESQFYDEPQLEIVEAGWYFKRQTIEAKEPPGGSAYLNIDPGKDPK